MLSSNHRPCYLGYLGTFDNPRNADIVRRIATLLRVVIYAVVTLWAATNDDG